MNENFVSIKVDREERPDLDQIYMDAVQLMTGRGGWPLYGVPDARRASRFTAAPIGRRRIAGDARLPRSVDPIASAYRQPGGHPPTTSSS